MLRHFAELTPKKIAVLVLLAIIAFKLGMSVVDSFRHVPDAFSETCQTLEIDIRQKLDDSNYCSTNKDCIAATLPCPFGCNSYVNESADLAPIREKITAYTNQCGLCVIECEAVTPVCVQGRCMSFETLASP